MLGRKAGADACSTGLSTPGAGRTRSASFRLTRLPAPAECCCVRANYRSEERRVGNEGRCALVGRGWGDSGRQAKWSGVGTAQERERGEACADKDTTRD